VLLFAVDIKIAGSLALAISLPTMLVAFARYSRDRSFDVLHANKRFMLAMAAGSIIGTILGGLLLGAVPPRCSLSPRRAPNTRRAESSSWPPRADDPPRDVI
jgi:uncharacterized membrane protein YfcA